MTILEAIESADELRAGNRISEDTKRKWLRSLDLKIYNEVILTHEHEEIRGDINGDGIIDEKDVKILDAVIMGTYTPTEKESLQCDVNKDGVIDKYDRPLLAQNVFPNYLSVTDATLLIPDIDAEAYVWYLVSQIDAASGESDRYNMSVDRFNLLYKRFTARYNREHTPINNYRVHNVMAVGGIS